MNKRLLLVQAEGSGLNRQGDGVPLAEGTSIAIEHGFTLLEVMVAMAIFGIAAITLLGVFSKGLNLIKATNDSTQAIILAQSKLAEITARLEQGVEGEEDGLAWEVHTSILGQGIKQVVLTISRDGKEKMRLVTLR